MTFKYRVTILVKASPQPSKSYSETVCCAGIDDAGKWRRLFPIRFRQLSSDAVFGRWDVVTFKSRRPTNDRRWESCHVYEDTIEKVARVKSSLEKSRIVDAATVDSEKDAEGAGQSLALIRPKNIRFTWRRRTPQEIEEVRTKFIAQMRQHSLFDKEVKAFEPCPFEFKMGYEDGAGKHKKTCGDWETSATFFNLRREYGEDEALKHLRETYTEKYVSKGIVFAIGNMKSRPQNWQLLGIFPSPETRQPSLF